MNGMDQTKTKTNNTPKDQNGMHQMERNKWRMESGQTNKDTVDYHLCLPDAHRNWSYLFKDIY